MLLTCGLHGPHMGIRQVRRMYARRWRAEDAQRFFGQLWHVERYLTRASGAWERLLGGVVCAGGFPNPAIRKET